MSLDMFEQAGFEALEANDVGRALRLLRLRDDIAGMFIDIKIGMGGDGLPLGRGCKKLRPHLALLFTSGRQAPDLASLPQRARFIGKPFNLNTAVILMKDLIAEEQHILLHQCHNGEGADGKPAGQRPL